jgi:hypothetical protein
MSVPDNPAKPSILAATYGVVLFSIIIQGPTLGFVARRTVATRVPNRNDKSWAPLRLRQEATMQWKMLDAGPPATYAIILAKGDEVTETLSRWVRERNVEAGSLTAIGAFERALLGYFDWSTKKYKHIPVDGQVEVLSLIGDVAVARDGPTLHMHAVLGKHDGSTVGGHLLEGHVRPTLEVTLIEPPAHLRKRKDEETGLALIDLGRS